MKKLFYLFTALTLMFAVGCEETPSGEVTYTLHADRTEVAVGESVVFTVVDSNGNDVTAQSNVCSIGGNCFISMTVRMDLPGEHIFEGHYIGNPEFPAGIATQNTVTVTVTE